MSNWVKKPLGEIIRLQRGHDLPSQDRKEGIVPIMGSSGITGYHNEIKTSGPGVVVGRSGNSMGEVSFSPVGYWPLNTCLYVTDFKGNDERYIYYLLQTIDFDQFNSGSAQKSLNRNAVYPYEVKTTECKDEQIRIGRVLADLEDKILLNHQTNQTLEQIAQAIFKSWFVDFEPTRAKIAAKQNGQDPERAAMAAIIGKSIAQLDQFSPENILQLQNAARLFPDNLIDSELGQIPEGWNYLEAIDVCGLTIGKTPPRKEHKWFSKNPSDIRWVSIKDMGAEGAYIQDTNEYLTEEAVNKFNVRRIPNNTVILSFKMTVGRVAITDGEMLSNEAIAHFKLVQKAGLSAEYLYLYLKGFDFDGLGSTSSIATAINSKMIKNMPVLVPSNEAINYFSDCIKPLFKQIRNLMSETKALIDTRDSLLRQLLSGELLNEVEED